MAGKDGLPSPQLHGTLLEMPSAISYLLLRHLSSSSCIVKSSAIPPLGVLVLCCVWREHSVRCLGELLRRYQGEGGPASFWGMPEEAGGGRGESRLCLVRATDS